MTTFDWVSLGLASLAMAAGYFSGRAGLLVRGALKVVLAIVVIGWNGAFGLGLMARESAISLAALAAFVSGSYWSGWFSWRLLSQKRTRGE